MAILLKRGIEEYSRTDEGALYAIKGLAAARIAAEPDSREPARVTSAKRYGVDIQGELCPVGARLRGPSSCEGDYLRVPVERIFLSEAARCGIGTYAPHDPSTADIADLVGSVDLAKVAEVGDEGDPRAWSWSGAVYAASRGMLEMIEILKVKREFLYLLLTMTQEKNVKVARFPLIYLDETILAHTNLAEFNKFLQEKENEALLDRMVIIKVPYALSYREEARIYKKLVYGRAGISQHASRSARAAPGGGVRDPDPPQQARARGTGSAEEGADLCGRGRGGRSPKPRPSDCAPNRPTKASPALVRAS